MTYGELRKIMQRRKVAPISREEWELSVKHVRMGMLDKTHDPDFRRIVASVIDVYSDLLYEDLCNGELRRRNS